MTTIINRPPTEVHIGAVARSSLIATLPDWHSPARRNGASKPTVIGILAGEGVGPEVIAAALDVLAAAQDEAGLKLDLRYAGPIGVEAEIKHGHSLTPEVIRFCETIFEDGGAVLCGPGGNRFVYNLRKQFDLYCKFTPIHPLAALRNAGPIRAEARDGVDIIVVRENAGGIYFGTGDRRSDSTRGEIAHHEFSYSRTEVRRIVDVAARLAARRRRRLCMVLKPNGVPEVSALWSDVLCEIAPHHAIETSVLEIDNAVYQIAASARQFDVVVAPNLFGDILSDTAALLLGSRGMSYSGNFGPAHRAVFQTGHGSAHDLAGKDRANPIGQIQSAAMMLSEAFGEHEAAAAIQRGIEIALATGARTPDIAGPDSRIVGTREMGRLIADSVRQAFAE